MAYCSNCGKPIDEQIGVCPTCQNAAVSDDALRAEEAACLDKSYRMFKFERLMWMLTGIFGIVLLAMIVLIVVLLIAVGSVVSELPLEVTADIFEDLPIQYYGLVLTIAAVMYGIIGLVICLPVVIANFKMKKRATYYMDTVYTDTAGAVKRAGAVGMIVLSALFSVFAMIFIIINFVHVRNNRAVFDRIIARQQAGE